MKKIIVKLLDLHDDKAKQKAMKAVSTLSGVDELSINMKEQKLTVIGTVDPVDVVSKLRKNGRTEILTVGPAKEPEKKEEPKKEEPKKEEEKKEEKKEEPKKEEEKKEEKKEEPKKEEEKKEEEKKKAEEPKKKEESAEKKPPSYPPELMAAAHFNPYKAYNHSFMATNAYPYMYSHPNYNHPYVNSHAYNNYNYHPSTPSTYHVQSAEENPSGCSVM